MGWLIVYLHVSAALVTASLVTSSRQYAYAAQGRPVLLAGLIVVVALVLWPIMLGVALGTARRQAPPRRSARLYREP